MFNPKPHHHLHHHPHHRPHAVRHHLDRDLEVLHLLVERRPNLNTENLISLVQELSLPHEIGEYLRIKILGDTDYGNISAESALAMADGHFRVKAGNEQNMIIQRCGDGKGALLFPLPPHVHRPFIDAGARPGVLIPDGHELPHDVNPSDVDLVVGTRECRLVLYSGKFKILVFELFRRDGRFLVEPEVGEVLQAGRIPGEIMIYGHLRPHYSPDDIDLDLPAQGVHLL